MKTVAALFFAAGAQALVSRGHSCCFHLHAHGGPGGYVGQLPDGQNRFGGHLPEGTYCIDDMGGLTDSMGRGCILTPPTTQFQCDVGATPTYGFSVNCHGQLEYHGSTHFVGCPTHDSGYNIYTQGVQSKCKPITLTADGCHKKCGGSPHPPPSQCPTKLGGNAYEFPHLIVPVNSAKPNTAYGTSYNGEITSTISTIFNFDIPASDAGKTCSLIFKLPKKGSLPTSSYHYSGSGGIEVCKLKGPANQGTTYANMPGVSANYGTVDVKPGHSYHVGSFPCPAGKTVAYEAKSHGTYLTYFQDYNPPAIGMYITTC